MLPHTHTCRVGLLALRQKAFYKAMQGHETYGDMGESSPPCPVPGEGHQQEGAKVANVPGDWELEVQFSAI